MTYTCTVYWKIQNYIVFVAQLQNWILCFWAFSILLFVNFKAARPKTKCTFFSSYGRFELYPEGVHKPFSRQLFSVNCNCRVRVQVWWYFSLEMSFSREENSGIFFSPLPPAGRKGNSKGYFQILDMEVFCCQHKWLFKPRRSISGQEEELSLGCWLCLDEVLWHENCLIYSWTEAGIMFVQVCVNAADAQKSRNTVCTLRGFANRKVQKYRVP